MTGLSPVRLAPCLAHKKKSGPTASGRSGFLRFLPHRHLSGPRRRPLFAPRSPLALVSSSRGAKSSHFRRRFSPSQAPGGCLSLLPAPRYPLCLRFGEQNLHISAAGFELLGRPAAASLCSPRPAIPYAFVPGSKIFTFPPPDLSFSGARRAAPLCSPPPAKQKNEMHDGFR